MTWLDRLIQSWRIRKASKYIFETARVLDIGCADGHLFRACRYLQGGIGIDPDLPSNIPLQNALLVSGFFPQDLPDRRGFDVITMLAVLEHIPPTGQRPLARECFDVLKPGGTLVITVPSPLTDTVLEVLKRLRLIDGMNLEEHYGYDVRLTPRLFCEAGFELLRSERFQLGLNNLFVFARPAATEAAGAP